MNTELLEALNILEKEKDISKGTLLDAIENSLLNACKNHFGKADNVKVIMDRETCDYRLFAEKTVVEDVEDKLEQISLEEAQEIDGSYTLGDVVQIPIESKSFGRIATQNAKNLILQKIREEERSVIYNQYFEKEKDVVTGIVQRYMGKNISINLGKADAILNENEQVRTEHFRPTERIKVYILEVRNTPKGPRILVSRTHPELVKRLFESEVTEIKDGTVEIMSIAREAGSRTKIAVRSNNPNVDAVGACVGLNGARVNSIVDELCGEKIDIVNWDENPGNLIQNALVHGRGNLVIRQSGEAKQSLCLTFENRIAEGSAPDPKQIFDRFYKADFSRRKGSSGLGLFIVKELMHRMGGDAAAKLNGNLLQITLFFPQSVQSAAPDPPVS